MHKCAILQSNYIPWKGTFDLINQVDSFIFLEDVDYTTRDWRTRNKIKTSNDTTWLSVPVKKAPRGTKIYQIEIVQDQNWQEKHYKTILMNYKRAPFFNQNHYLLEEIYLKNKWSNLSEFNIFTIKLLAKALNITHTEFISSLNLTSSGTKDDKLIQLCQKVGADFYLSGPAAKVYIDQDNFSNANIQLAYINYNNYPSYKQLHGQFDHHVSVLDVLFNCGNAAQEFIFMNKFTLD